MATTVEMPQLGETVTEGTILEIMVPEGETVEVGAPLVRIGEPDEGASPAPAAEPVPAQAAEPEPQSEPEPQPQAEPAPEPAAASAAAASGETTTVEMPQLGETVTEGTILSWAKQVGDSIEADEVLVEISTDKVDTEVPSPVSGTILEIMVPEGETVEVGAPLVRIGQPDEGAAAAPEHRASPSHRPLRPRLQLQQLPPRRSPVSERRTVEPTRRGSCCRRSSAS